MSEENTLPSVAERVEQVRGFFKEGQSLEANMSAAVEAIAHAADEHFRRASQLEQTASNLDGRVDSAVDSVLNMEGFESLKLAYNSLNILADSQQSEYLSNAIKGDDGLYYYANNGAAFKHALEEDSYKTYSAISGQAGEQINWIEAQVLSPKGVISNSNFIYNEHTIHVGVHGDFETIQEAWNSLKGKVIISPVIIKVEDGEHIIDSLVISQQPYADLIKIIGNVTNPQSCILRLNSSSSSKAIVDFRNIKHLEFSGFKIIGIAGNSELKGLKLSFSNVVSQPGSLLFEDVCSPIFLNTHSRFVGENINSLNAKFSAIIDGNSHAILNGLVTKSQNNKVEHSYGIAARNSSVEANNINISGFQHGVEAAENSRVDVRNADLSNCLLGLYGYSSTIIAYSDGGLTTISDCDNGAVATHDAVIHLDNASISDCSVYGLYARDGGRINSTGSNFSNNAKDTNLAFNILGSDGSYIKN